MSILRLEVGVQGSTDPASFPFLGVVRGPMVGSFTGFVHREKRLWSINRVPEFYTAMVLVRRKEKIRVIKI